MASYEWVGPGGFAGSTPCITVDEAGRYELTIVDGSGGTSTCGICVGSDGGDDDDGDDDHGDDDGDDDDKALDAALAATLYKPSPNPFTSSTRMAYTVGRSGGARVEIAVYNTSGQKVRTLVSGTQTPGGHEIFWNGSDDRGAKAPAGVYFLRSVVAEKTTVTRVVLVR
jgi:hypothetical protein